MILVRIIGLLLCVVLPFLVHAQTQLITFESKDKWGFMNSEGKIVVKPKYDDAFIQNNGYIWIRKGKKYGFLDPKGKFIHKCEFDFFDHIKLGSSYYTKNYCFTVKKGKKWGVLGKRGEWYQPIELDTVHDFHDTHIKSKTDFEILALAVKNNKKGFINLKGKWAIPCEYDDLEYFNEDYCIAKKNGKHGVIDPNNLSFIPFEYDKLKAFGKYFTAQKGKKWGILNRKHKVIHPFEFDSLIYSDEKYTGLADNEDVSKHYLNEKVVSGYIGGVAVTRLSGKNIEGLTIPSPSDNVPFQTGGNFYSLKKPIYHEGLAQVPLNKILMEADQDDISVFSMNKYLLHKKDKKSGLRDSAGKVLFPQEYKGIYIIRDNEHAEIKVDREQITAELPRYILTVKSVKPDKEEKNKTGKKIEEPDEEEEKNEDEDEKYLRYGLYDSTGKTIFGTDYIHVSKYHAVKKTGKEDKYEVLINRKGQPAFPSEYEELYITAPNRIVGVKDRKIYWLDTTGKIFLGGGIEWFLPISSKRFWTFDGKRQRIVDEEGKPVFPTEYDRLTMYFPVINNWLGSKTRETGDVNYFQWWSNRSRVALFPDFVHSVLSFTHASVRREKDKKLGLTDSTGKLLSPDFYAEDKFYVTRSKGCVIAETGTDSRAVYTSYGKKYEFKDCEYAEPIYELKRSLSMKDFFTWQKTGELPGDVKNLLPEMRDPKLFTKIDRPRPLFFAVNRHEKWGITDTTGKLLTEMEYDVLSSTALDSLLIVGKNQHWGVEGCDNYGYGFINKKTGKPVTDFIYLRNNYSGGVFESHPKFGKTLIPVRTAKGYGILSASGKEIQPPVYDNIMAFSPEALLLIKGKVAGIMDWNGKWICDTILDADQARSAQEGNWLEVTFKKIVQHIRDKEAREIRHKKSLRSYLMLVKKKLPEDKAKSKEKDADRLAFFDVMSNKFVTDFVYSQGKDIGWFENSWLKKNGQYIYVDTANKPVINIAGLDSVKLDFEERIYYRRDSVVHYAVAARANGKWGVIDNKGNTILPFHWDNMALNQHYRYYAIASKGGKYGAIDFKGNVKLDYKYDSVGLVNRHLFKIREKITGEDTVRWHLVNTKGKQLASAKMKDNIYAFTMDDKSCVQNGDSLFIYKTDGKFIDEMYNELIGLAAMANTFTDVEYWNMPAKAASVFAVKKGNSYGMIDTLGNVVIPFDYDKIEALSVPDGKGGSRNHFPNELRYWVLKKTGTYETYAKSGEPIPQDSFKLYTDLSKRRLVIAERKGKTGVADSTLKKVVIPFDYDDVSFTSSRHWIVSKRLNEVTRYGLLDSSGKEVIPVKYKNIVRVARGGEYASEDDFEDPEFDPQTSSGQKLKEFLSPPKLFQVKDEKGKEGWVDYSGKFTVPCKYDDISPTSRRDCWFITLEKKYGWIDSTGAEKAPPVYDDLTFDSHAKEFVRTEQGGKFGLMRYDGTEVLPCKYDEIGQLRNNLISVKENGLWGMYDFQMKQILKIEYQNAEDYGCSCCPDIRFTRMKKDGKIGLSMNGQMILPCKYSDINEVYANGLAEVRNAPTGKWGLVEKLTGKPVADFEYDQVYVLEGSLEDVFVKVRIGNKYGLVSAQGQAVKCEWDEIRSVNANALAGRKDKKWTLLDLKGRPLNPKTFDRILAEYQSIKKKTAED